MTKLVPPTSLTSWQRMGIAAPVVHRCPGSPHVLHIPCPRALWSACLFQRLNDNRYVGSLCRALLLTLHIRLVCALSTARTHGFYGKGGCRTAGRAHHRRKQSSLPLTLLTSRAAFRELFSKSWFVYNRLSLLVHDPEQSQAILCIQQTQALDDTLLSCHNVRPIRIAHLEGGEKVG